MFLSRSEKRHLLIAEQQAAFNAQQRARVSVSPLVSWQLNLTQPFPGHYSLFKNRRGRKEERTLRWFTMANLRLPRLSWFGTLWRVADFLLSEVKAEDGKADCILDPVFELSSHLSHAKPFPPPWRSVMFILMLIW